MSSAAPRSPRPTLKIILVGGSSVGKTCLVNTFFNNAFDASTPPTVAPAYSSANVRRQDGSMITLQIWDTAGQERYHSVSKLFYRDADVALVCFSVENEQSREDIPEWVRRVHESVSNCEIMLVLTKSDLVTEEEVNRIKTEVEEKYGSNSYSPVFVTSSLKKSGVTEVFQATTSIGQPSLVDNQVKPVIQENQQSEKGCC